MMVENIDSSCCLAFNGDKQWLRKKAQLSITLNKILGTLTIPTCNESSASKKSSLPVIIKLVNQFIFYDFSKEIENTQR